MTLCPRGCPQVKRRQVYNPELALMRVRRANTKTANPELALVRVRRAYKHAVLYQLVRLASSSGSAPRYTPDTRRSSGED